MIIKEIQLYQFRNFLHQKVELKPGFNLIFGENGSGKTSFLEAVHLFYTGNTFRDPFDRLIHHGAEKGGVRGWMVEGYREIDKTVLLTREGVTREINGKRIPSLREFRTHHTILFEPYDTMLIDGSPGGRRRFFDSILVEVSPSYEKNIHEYQALLKLRNNHLRYSPRPERFLDTLDGDFLRLNRSIYEERKRFLELILKRTLRHLHEIEGEWQMDMELLPSWDIEESGSFRDRRLEEDIRRKYTTWGIHQDDVGISFQGLEAKSSASRGQKRAMVISMKLANLDIFEKLSNKETILLLDDLLYELDSLRQFRLIKKIEKYTALVTSTVRMEADHTICIQENRLKVLS